MELYIDFTTTTFVHTEAGWTILKFKLHCFIAMESQVNSSNTVDDNFPDLPPFPDDVPTAPLLRLELGKLLAGDTCGCEKLFQASVDIGFFYLDLQDSTQGISLLGDADDLFQVGQKLFELSLEEKMRYDFSAQNSYFGYKAQGAAVVDRQGNLDRNEFYNVRPPFPQAK